MSFPGSYSLNQHLVLCRVRHWHLSELDHTDLSAEGSKDKAGIIPAIKKTELRIVAKLWLACSSKATATMPVMSVTRDSRTLPASGCP